MTMQNYPKRLIEVDLPIARISAHARQEKDSRCGHIPRLHIYPAARPLAACRAVVCATLWPDPVDLSEWATRGEEVTVGDTVVRPALFLETARDLMRVWGKEHLAKASPESYANFVAIQQGSNLLNDPQFLRRVLLDFIADFANWDNSTDKDFLETARALTRSAHQALGVATGDKPIIFDPFAGGGAIPLEALRVGAEAFATDLNPLSVMINRVVLEHVPEFGQELADELAKFKEWLREQSRKELGLFFPKDSDGATPIAYLWARTILSEAPSAGDHPIEIPMLRSMWLTRGRSNGNWALRWARDNSGRPLTKVVDVVFSDGKRRKVRRLIFEVFQPKGPAEVPPATVRGGSVTCPVTGFTTPVKQVRA